MSDLTYNQMQDVSGAIRVDQVRRSDGVNVLTGFMPFGDDVIAIPDFDDPDGLAYQGWLKAGGKVGSPATDLAAYARAKSYEIRIGGTAVNGLPVKTDADTISLINGMAALAKDDGTLTFSFDTGAAPVTLTADQAIAVSTAVGRWVQGTFTKRADVLGKIAAGTIKSTADIDAAFAG